MPTIKNIIVRKIKLCKKKKKYKYKFCTVYYGYCLVKYVPIYKYLCLIV